MAIFHCPIEDARQMYPEYDFVRALTPSAQKAAFHVKDKEGNDLCLKVIAPNYERDRLDREIQAMQTIQHPNVVRLKEYTFSSKPGQQRHYIVEEFIDGADLSAHLVPGTPWDPKRAAAFFSALCDGLAVLNQHDIVHRDIKPANVRVRPDGSPVLIDFGLARLLQLPDLTRTADGAQLGTPAYFAPEQFQGTKYDIDHRTDLFAVGLLLYESLTGQSAFLRANMTWTELEVAVCQSTTYLQEPAFLGLDHRWRLLLTRLLDKDRARRPNHASQVAAMIRKIGGI